MKQRIAKGWSLLLAMLVLLSVLPMGALAEEAQQPAGELGAVYQWTDGEQGYALMETRDTLGGDEAGYSAAQTFSAPLGSYDDGSFYGQLTARQKACYDQLAGLLPNEILFAAEVDGYRQVQMFVQELYNLTLTGSIQNSTFVPDSASQALYRSIYTDLCAAITALRYDQPGLLWLSDMRYGITWSSTDGRSVTTGNVVFAFRLQYGGKEQQMWLEQAEAAQQIADQAAQYPTRYEQIQAVHDLLAAQSTYNYGALEEDGTVNANLSHQAYSCLIAGDAYEPVCDGYAKAVKMVCDLLEIPCALASSDTHMWNNIKMDDGDWYNLDLTWDDANDQAISYDYFLIGSQTVVDGQAFSRQPDHVEENPWQESSDLNHVNFGYPVKNQKAYQLVEGGYDPLRFPDVKRSAWYYDYVESAADMGLFSGDERGFFNPQKDITRAEFVQVLYNALAPEDYVPAGTSFTDIKTGDWFYAPVCWAEELGVVSGYEDGGFHPSGLISREEMCVVLNNYMQSITGGTASQDEGFQFPDDSRISSWAKEAVYNAYQLGLVSGDEKGLFNPGDNTQRCQAATVFTKYVAVLEGIAA